MPELAAVFNPGVSAKLKQGSSDSCNKPITRFRAFLIAG